MYKGVCLENGCFLVWKLAVFFSGIGLNHTYVGPTLGSGGEARVPPGSPSLDPRLSFPHTSVDLTCKSRTAVFILLRVSSRNINVS